MDPQVVLTVLRVSTNLTREELNALPVIQELILQSMDLLNVFSVAMVIISPMKAELNALLVSRVHIHQQMGLLNASGVVQDIINQMKVRPYVCHVNQGCFHLLMDRHNV